jgi:hypothetical protein
MPSRNQSEVNTACYSRHADCLFRVFFNPEEEGDMFFPQKPVNLHRTARRYFPEVDHRRDTSNPTKFNVLSWRQRTVTNKLSSFRLDE